MGVHVIALTTDEVMLGAPLAPNINHRETVFGGSASALCILAAWSLVHVRLRAAQCDARLVIQRNAMEYLAPVQGEFHARASLRDAADWGAFVRILQRKGRARLGVVSLLESDGALAGRFEGEFVALGGATYSAATPVV